MFFVLAVSTVFTVSTLSIVSTVSIVSTYCFLRYSARTINDLFFLRMLPAACMHYLEVMQKVLYMLPWQHACTIQMICEEC